jgi:hypothetical protein
MSSSGNVVAFNNYLKEFVGKLHGMFPENDKVSIAKNMFHTLLLTDKEIYIRHFHEHALKKFKNDILARNEQVFLNADFSFIPEAAEFKGIWKTLDDKQKVPIWDYLKVLTVLAARQYPHTK